MEENKILSTLFLAREPEIYKMINENVDEEIEEYPDENEIMGYINNITDISLKKKIKSKFDEYITKRNLEQTISNKVFYQQGFNDSINLYMNSKKGRE